MQFPGYTIEGLLYQGSRTVVYKAIRLYDSLPVVIKALQPGFDGPEYLTRLRHEFEIARDLELETVVKALAFETAGTKVALVLEDFGGVSLKNSIAGGGMPLGPFLDVAIGVTHALGQLHGRLIIHKDIKPANLLFNPLTGQTKISDLGISTRLQSEYYSTTRSDAFEGSVRYMSPEQTGRMNRALDYRSDFYSLGVSFYEMLTGRLPYQANDPLEWVHCHIARNPTPPHLVNATVPPAVSAIVMKLMAKTAEERYQSTDGVIADLEHCRELSQSGLPVQFAVGRHDINNQFRLSQRLYGREEDIQTLLDAFGRVSHGSSELILVTGFSGIGKTSIVREIHKPVVKHRGYFVSGKSEQFQRDVPYSALVQAFRELIRQILTESDDSIARWRGALKAALGDNGKVVADLIPELHLIIGEQPELPELPAAESQNRFNLVLRQFIAVFATREHPLALFIDDLHWADHASLKLIQQLATLPGIPFLLIIGAYRDHEVSPTHAVVQMLDATHKAGIVVHQIAPGPLSVGHVNRLISDTLGCAETECRALAELIAGKTGGNPYFINELLKTLHDEKLLIYDAGRGGWSWDEKHIKAMRVAESMAELVASRILNMPEETRQALSLAACMGNRFSLNILSLLLERDSHQVAQVLWPAVDGSFIVADRLFRVDASAGLDEMMLSFIHDRVQQACYLLISDQQRRQTHLKMARLLLHDPRAVEREVSIFELVNHLNEARDLLLDPDERRCASEHNLIAGEKALASNAYESGLKFIAAGMEFLGENAWEDDYALCSLLHIRRLECELLCNHFEEAERLFDENLKRLKTPEEKAQVYVIKIVLCANLGRFVEAIQLGRESLKMFGLSLPLLPGKGAIVLQYFRSRWLRRLRCCNSNGTSGVAALLNLPEMPSQRRAGMDILASIGAPAYLHDKNLFALIALQMVNLSLEHGHSRVSPFAYALYGMMIIAAFGEFDAGFAFGELALRLVEQGDDRLSAGKTAFVFHNFVAHTRQPLAQGARALQEVFQDCLRCGDLVYAGYSLLARLLHLSSAGETLDNVLGEAERHLEFLRTIRNEDALLFTCVVKRHARCLQELPSDAERAEEEEQLSLMKRKQALVPLQGYYQFKCQALYMLDHPADALTAAAEAEKLSEAALGQSYQADHYLFYSLAIAANWPHLSVREKRHLKKVLKRNLKWLTLRSAHCPENHLHKQLLVHGEMARIFGEPVRALALYEEAALAAKRHGFKQCEAIACELAADLCMARQAETAARAYHLRCCQAFSAWGAGAKLRLLEKKHPGWQVPAQAELKPGEETVSVPTVASSTSGSEMLDMMTVIKVSQAISGEMDLERLLHRLIAIVIENAGAARGVLVLERDGRLLIEAEGSADRSGAVVLQSQPLEENDALPLSVVNFVARSHESVLLDNALLSDMFGSDPYHAGKAAMSILCLPIIHQGRMVGILYLENRLATGAFTRSRLHVLELLSSQVAISIQNARLYHGLRQVTDELAENNRTLEHKVAERTRALSDEVEERKKAEAAAEEANRTKSNFLSTVSHELRTPLTSVLGFARIIRKKLDDSVLPVLKPEDAKAARSLGQIREVVDIIVTEGERLTVLIDDVLDLAKMESGKLTWKYQPLALAEVVERAAASVSPLLAQKNLGLVKAVDPDLPEILADRDRLIQVVINLLSNAWKFTDHGYIMIRADLLDVADQETIKVSVTDTGIGIAAEDQGKVFEKFKQVGDTLTDKPKGTGLGLPICKEIIESHGGKIGLESEPGRGSTFFFTLPVAHRSQDPAAMAVAQT